MNVPYAPRPHRRLSDALSAPLTALTRELERWAYLHPQSLQKTPRRRSADVPAPVFHNRTTDTRQGA